MQINPFKKTADKQIIEALKSIATENYGNPFSELARVKAKARELLKQLKTKEGKKNAPVKQS